MNAPFFGGKPRGAIRHYVVAALALLVVLALVFERYGAALLSAQSQAVMQEVGLGAVTSTQPALPKLVVTYRDVPPDMVLYSPGRFAGPLRTVIEEAAGKIGYRIEWKSMPFSESLAAAAAGDVDIVPYIRFKTEEREKQVRFSESLGKGPATVNFVQRVEDTRKIETLDDLKGRTVGFRTGVYYFDNFETDSRFNKIGYVDDKRLARAFIDRKVDVVAVNIKPATERALTATGFGASNYKYASLSIVRNADLYLVYTKVARRQEVFDRLDRELAKMRDQGEIEDIYTSFDVDAPKAK